jgi:uncharacterized protein (TIGR02118 family)
MIRVSILYPRPGKFDYDYYANEHMQLVHKLLTPFGLVKSEVDRGVESSPYLAVGHMFFNTIEEMHRGLQAHDPDLQADLVNFTDIEPQFQVSEII